MSSATLARHTGSAGDGPGSAFAPAPEMRVVRGPVLLRSVGTTSGLDAHRHLRGPLPEISADDLRSLTMGSAIRGRGGAAFPFGRKVEAVRAARRRLGGRPVVVVNAAEGEPASAKDSALLAHAPHLVLDGAALCAGALGAREIHVVTSADRPGSGAEVRQALAERADDRSDGSLRWLQHEAPGRFVSGQAAAVLELLAGRAALPVTTWIPPAVRGHRGRPTLLSNAETFAHVAALVHDPIGYAAHGTPSAPGTTLLTVSRGVTRAGLPTPTVIEVEHGAPWAAVLGDDDLAGPVLLGGFHGTWAAAGMLRDLPIDAADMTAKGLALGAGVVLAPAERECPVALTSALTSYLARETAGRCGPCRNGLPALAGELGGLAEGADTRRRIRELCGLVRGRGACAHPDGTTRLVGSLLSTLEAAVEAHLSGACACGPAGIGRG